MPRDVPVKISDIHPSNILAALVIGAVLGVYFGLAVFPEMPLIAALSCAAFIVSMMAVGLAIVGLIEWLGTVRSLRKLRGDK
jgi:hypothetical protein